MPIPNIFDEFITSEVDTPDEVMPVDSPELYLTLDEAIQEFKTFVNIINYAYSGRQYWEKKSGIPFLEISALYEAHLKEENKSNVSIPGLCEYCYSFLSEFNIVDNHLKMYTLYNGIFMFNANYNAYFSDITVKKSGGSYYVIKSDIASIHKDSEIIISESNLFKTLSPSGEEYYLIGLRSWKNEESISLICNGEKICIPLHRCRSGKCENDTSDYFDIVKKDDIITVRSKSFALTDSISFDMARKSGEQLQNTELFVWDISNNGGGSSDYPNRFIRGLNGGYAECNINAANLHSNYIDAAYDEKPYYKWEYSLDNDYCHEMSKYDGQCIVIINSKTASAAEMAIGYAKCLKNCILIGENSCGCGVFGDLKYYQLPYSKTTMAVPSKIFIGEFEEGKGYTPDIWVDSDDVEGDVIKWLKSNSKK